MSGNSDLERDIGELSGTLKSLVPALERLEARMNKAENTAAASSVEVQHLIQQFSALRDQATRSIEEFKRKSQGLADAQGKAIGRLQTDLKDVSDKVTEILRRRDSNWKKVWDLAKILIAALVGAVGTKYLK